MPNVLSDVSDCLDRLALAWTATVGSRLLSATLIVV